MARPPVSAQKLSAALAAVDAGQTVENAAQLGGVSPRTLKRALAARRGSSKAGAGSLSAPQSPGRAARAPQAPRPAPRGAERPQAPAAAGVEAPAQPAPVLAPVGPPLATAKLEELAALCARLPLDQEDRLVRGLPLEALRSAAIARGLARFPEAAASVARELRALEV